MLYITWNKLQRVPIKLMLPTIHAAYHLCSTWSSWSQLWNGGYWCNCRWCWHHSNPDHQQHRELKRMGLRYHVSSTQNTYSDIFKEPAKTKLLRQGLRQRQVFPPTYSKQHERLDRMTTGLMLPTIHENIWHVFNINNRGVAKIIGCPDWN